jgi:hypothetical protein
MIKLIFGILIIAGAIFIILVWDWLDDKFGKA